MSEERVVIDAYVYPGIRPVDLPENFLKKVKVSVLNYKKEHVIDGIQRYKKVTQEELQSRCRKRKLCDARHMYCNILRTKMDYSLIDIGRTLGRDHTTVINSIKCHESLYGTDEVYTRIYDKVDRYVDIMSASDNNGEEQ